jgi:hypothetical protein
MCFYYKLHLNYPENVSLGVAFEYKLMHVNLNTISTTIILDIYFHVFAVVVVIYLGILCQLEHVQLQRSFPSHGYSPILKF